MTTSAQQPTQMQRALFLIICFIAGAILIGWYQYLLNERAYDLSVAPDFSAIENSDSRKQQFLDYLYPLIAAENNKILQTRAQLIAIEKQLQTEAGSGVEQILWLERLAGHYAVNYDATKPQATVRVLLRRINVIPPSLALAQAANETAWGTSRFAIEANNYFGQWCYSEGCGLVPLERSEGLSHEVKNFYSVADSVRSYLHTLNTGRAYARLRNLRQQLLDQQKPLSGVELAAGLTKYSERGAAYVASIQSLIESNHLQSYADALYVALDEERTEQPF